jgi:hypothetical protein
MKTKAVPAERLQMKKDIVQLSGEERQVLKQLISSGIVPARKIVYAQILFKADSSEAGSA